MMKENEMNSQERIYQVTKQINDRIEYCISEYDLTLAEVVGILEIIKLETVNNEREDYERE